MKLTIAQLERHGENLDAIAAEAEAAYRADLLDFASRFGDFSGWDNRSKAEFRDYAVDRLMEHWGNFGEASASMGSMLYDNLIPADTVGEPGGSIASGDAAAGSAHYWAKFLYGGGEDGYRKFVDGTSSFLRRHVVHASDKRIADRAKADGKRAKGIRYARVPTGPTCGFCIMLASRGFVYLSRESAGAPEFERFHDGCDCKIVAGTDGLEIEGYDPELWYQQYRRCRDAIDWEVPGTGESALWRDWSRLGTTEQARYADDHGADAYNNYVMHRVAAEMDTRDRQWLYDGEPVPYSIAEGAAPSGQEKQLAELLGSSGFASEFRATRSREHKRTSDVFFRSGKDGLTATPWEFKHPSGNGKQTVHHQFEEAAGQSKRLVIDISGLGPYWTEELITAEIWRKLGRSYTVERGPMKGEKWTFVEAMTVDESGAVKKYSRG